MKELTLEIAKKALEVTEEWLRNTVKIPASIAIVDKAGALIASHRMDGAPMATVDIAIDKAWSSVAMKLPTLMLARISDPRNVGEHLGDHGLGVPLVCRRPIACIAGGIPVADDNLEVIGAIGSSGLPGMAKITDVTVSQKCLSALYE